jgi:pimeloyl-ACP methyl ester carboxylesterase
VSSIYSDHFYHSADGRLDLYARIYESAGPPLLLMHGLTRNSADFDGLAAHLAGRFKLIIPDQRGRGRSQYDPEPAQYNPATYVADMLALLDGLQISKATLIGTSMGGLMAMIMGAMAPQRVRAMILNDIGPAVDPAGLIRIQAYVGQAAAFTTWDEAAKYCAAINRDALANYDDDDWMKFARQTCTTSADGHIVFAYDPAIASGLSGTGQTAVPPDLWPMWDMLADIPVLALRGAHSDILSSDIVTEMARRHPNDFASIEISGRGHAPMLDEPDAIQAIDAFLSGHTS